MNEPSDGVRSPGAAGHFEWWYFDFPVGEGGLARIEWHAPLFNLRDRSCVLVLRCSGLPGSGPGQPPLIRAARFPRTRVELGHERCDIRFPTGRIVEEPDGYRIEIADPVFSADLHLARELPPLASPDGEIFGSPDGKETLCWTVPLPRARAAGSLTVDGRTLAVEGSAYHDHNWGNLRFGRHLRRWTWLRVPFDSLTLIFARIERRGGDGPLDLLVALDRQGRPVGGPPPDVTFADERESPCGLIRFPAAISLGFGREPAFRVELETVDAVAVQEEPLGALGYRPLDNLYARLWYAAGRRLIPRPVRRRAGRLFYFLAAATARLDSGDGTVEEARGMLEVFHCDP